MKKNKYPEQFTVGSENFILRPLNLKKDYNELISFYDYIFEKDLLAKGSSVKATLDEMVAFQPFFNLIGIFSKSFRHILDGFVIKNSEGKIISTVNIGFSYNYWEISMVATHPDYRGRGLAKKIVSEAIEHAINNGAKICVLEVLEENTPAYELYKKLGFNHFDTQIKLKLPPDNLTQIVESVLPNNYSIRKAKVNKKIGKALFELEKAVTPIDVQKFLPVNKSKFIKPFLIRLIRPFLKIFVKMRAIRWIIINNEKIVANIFIRLGKSKNDCNSFDVTIDPEHQKMIIKPIISILSKHIKSNSKFQLNTITMTRKSEDLLLNELKLANFVVYEIDHVLGLKL